MGDRQTLVLLPGLVCDAEVWDYPSRYLSDITECRIMESRGSDTVAEFAQEVLDTVTGPFAIAGFSMGGYVAMEVLRQAPEKVTRLAVLDATARGETPEKTEGRLKAIAKCDAGNYEEAIEDMLPLLLHPERLGDPLADRVRAMAVRVGVDDFVRRHRAIMGRQASLDLIESADIPVRVICGRDDRLASLEEHQQIADLAPRGRLSIIEDCGHMPPLEQPQAATALLRDWLLYG